jgi:hypothetical protein
MTTNQIAFLILWNLPAVLLIVAGLYRLRKFPDERKRTLQFTSLALSAYVLLSLWLNPFHGVK